MSISKLILETIQSSGLADRLYKQYQKTHKLSYKQLAYDNHHNVNFPANHTKKTISRRIDGLIDASADAQKVMSAYDLTNPKSAALVARGQTLRDRSQNRPSSMTVDPPSAASNAIRKQMESRGSLRNKLVSSKNPFLRALGK